MGYQIVKNLREENGDIVCSMCSNNVRPRSFYEWRKPKNGETIAMVKQFLIDRVWQPIHNDTKFIQSLGVTHYFDGTSFNS